MKTIYADITTFEGKNTVIAHVCNDKGYWGAGVAVAIGERWPEAEDKFFRWKSYTNNPAALAEFALPSFSLGNICYALVDTENDVHVCNMIAQRGVRGKGNPVPLDMDALQQCLLKLAQDAKFDGKDVIMPKIGSGLAGGDWEEISVMVDNIFNSYGVSVTVYDWNP